MKKRTKRLGIAGIILVFLLLLCFGFSSQILRTAARIWVIDSTPTEPVEAIVVPGGGVETRPFAAAKLFHSGISDKLILFQTEQRPSEVLGLSRPSHEVTLEVLESEKVPPDNVEIITGGVTSTRDEVELIRKWVKETEIDSLVVVTDVFPSRRVEKAYRKGLRGLDVTLHVHPVPARHYTVDTWWENEHGLIAFQNEVIKHLYYLARY
ncbi:MAG: ElyC/SanA/YdcF family protein [Verrucomicrobiota bacterium]